MNDDLRPDLEAGLRQLGLDAALAEPLLAYLALLARWNATYNLTAIRDPREMLVKHLLDSLAMHAHLDGIGNLADLGTGPACPASRSPSHDRTCRWCWSRATARRRASCARRCAS